MNKHKHYEKMIRPMLEQLETRTAEDVLAVIMLGRCSSIETSRGHRYIKTSYKNHAMVHRLERRNFWLKARHVRAIKRAAWLYKKLEWL